MRSNRSDIDGKNLEQFEFININPGLILSPRRVS